MARKPTVFKDDIIEAALEGFIELGFEETTFKHIADKLGIKPQAIYHYFQNKMDLLSGCSAWAALKGRTYILEKINPKNPAQTRLNQYVSGNLQFFAKHRKEAFAMTAVYFFAQVNPTLKDTYNQIQKASIETIEGMLVQISYEEKKKLKDSLIVSESIHSMLVGEIYKILYSKRNYKTEDKENVFLGHVRLLIESALH